jgi:hypothetical protein
MDIPPNLQLTAMMVRDFFITKTQAYLAPDIPTQQLYSTILDRGASTSIIRIEKTNQDRKDQTGMAQIT